MGLFMERCRDFRKNDLSEKKKFILLPPAKKKEKENLKKKKSLDEWFFLGKKNWKSTEEPLRTVA